MKIFIILIISVFHFCCTSRINKVMFYEISHNVSRDYSMKYKFYSYKDYLIEFINKEESNSNINFGIKKEESKTLHQLIYFYKKNDTSILAFDTFKLDAKFVSKTTFKEKLGIGFGDFDEMTKVAYNKTIWRDTSLNNINYKLFDTMYIYRNLNLRNVFLFSNTKINTIININSKLNSEKIYPYNLKSISVYDSSNQLMSINFSEAQELSSKEVEIFEAIIKKAKGL